MKRLPYSGSLLHFGRLARLGPAHLGCLAFLLAGGSAWASGNRSTRRPYEGLVFRADLSAVASLNQEQESNEAAGFLSRSSDSVSVGPRLAVNLGIAPIRLLRVGVFAAVEGAPHISLDSSADGDLPSGKVDGHLRLTFGPTVGFRFGPSVPLELELGLGVARQSQFGKSEIDVAGNADRDRWGGEGSLLLFYRPGGAGDDFALHLGGIGGVTASGSGGAQAQAILGGFVLGLSIGL